MKKFFLCMLTIFSTVFIYGQKRQSAESLLQGYLENNLEIKKLTSELEKKVLSMQSTEISKGLSFQLSTGTVQMQFGDSSTISFSPEASLIIPQADNLKLTASTSVSLNSNDSNSKTLTGTSFSLSADIYSDYLDSRKIELLEAERKVLEGKRSLQNGLLSVESEFYKSLKTLYEIASQINNAEKNLYEDKIKFEKVKAQGYSSGSVTYRLAQSEVSSDEHSVEEAKHKLERETRIFAYKCGITYEGNDAMEFLPGEVPEVEAVDIKIFPEESYTKIEKAAWEKYINGLKRASEKSHTLKGSVGYTFDNKVSSPGAGSNKFTDTVDAGLSYSWDSTALTASAGVSVPLDSSSPLYKLGLSFNPNQFRLKKIEKKMDEEDVKLENIAMENARLDFGTTVISLNTNIKDIQWNKQANLETYDMYNTLEKDSALYLERGIISESEYKSALVNKENYRIKLLINRLEVIIYNNDAKLNFVRDDEL